MQVKYCLLLRLTYVKQTSDCSVKYFNRLNGLKLDRVILSLSFCEYKTRFVTAQEGKEVGMFGNKQLRSALRKEQEAKKKFMMKSIKISTLHQIIYHSDQVSKCKMGEECSIRSVVRKLEGNK